FRAGNSWKCVRIQADHRGDELAEPVALVLFATELAGIGRVQREPLKDEAGVRVSSLLLGATEPADRPVQVVAASASCTSRMARWRCFRASAASGGMKAQDGETCPVCRCQRWAGGLCSPVPAGHS